MTSPRIKKLQIKDFRSLFGNHTIDLGAKGKNVFIFGENGAGKSSICRALNIFFEATDLRKKRLHISNFENRHVPTNKSKNAEIALEMTNGVNFAYDHNGYKGELSVLQESRRMKGFLEYKNLLPIYLYENRNNLFRFFVESPFANLRNPVTNKQISTEWFGTKKTSLHKTFYDGVFQLASELTDDINEVLSYFDKSMKINFRKSKTWTTGELYIEVTLNENYKINDYGEYLNEARLVALAISIYLATVLKYKIEHEKESKDVAKLLILDDIFIGMDMSNRLPLLKLIQDKFADYQVFITTYDEYWFKLAQTFLNKTDWKFLKVYSKQESQKFMKSEIQDDELDDYIKKAKHYFNLNDYPACANYQRKAFEEKVRLILPENLLHNAADNGQIKRNDKFISDFNNFLKYLDECGLDNSVFDDFKLYSKMILNPLSHDNYGSPIYRKEIESVFGILSEFEKISNDTLREASEKELTTMNLSIKDTDEIWHNYKFNILDNLRRVKQREKTSYAPCRFQITEYKKDKQIDQIFHTEPEDMQKLYEKICNYHNVEINDFSEDYLTNKGVPISEMKSLQNITI